MTRQWFTTIAIAEGLSFVALMGIAMPLKYVAGIEEATAVAGWVHGIMVFVYMIALWSVARVDGWSWGKTALGFIAAMLPFGPFVFAKKLHD